MATYEERKAELQKQHRAAVARLNQELAILALIPQDLMGFEIMAHPHRLYDRIGMLHVRHCEYDSLRKGPDPTPADVLRFVAAFPPVDAAVYRDGCVGVRTLSDAYHQLEQAQERMGQGHDTSATVTPMASFWLSFEAASYSGHTTIHWLSQTAIGILEIEITFRSYGALAPIGRVEIRRQGSSEYSQTKITSAALVISDVCRVVGDAKAETISFGLSNDRLEPGPRLLYYCSHNGDPSTITIADLFAAAGITV